VKKEHSILHSILSKVHNVNYWTVFQYILIQESSSAEIPFHWPLTLRVTCATTLLLGKWKLTPEHSASRCLTCIFKSHMLSEFPLSYLEFPGLLVWSDCRRFNPLH
jgi:hypothetical protein